jgi:hypothetical protein
VVNGIKGGTKIKRHKYSGFMSLGGMVDMIIDHSIKILTRQGLLLRGHDDCEGNLVELAVETSQR